MLIRQATFTDTDYQHIANLHNAIEPEYPTNLEEIKFDLETVPKKIKFAIFFAEHNGEVVALGDYKQRSGNYHPQKFFIKVAVHPKFRNQGIATKLYQHILKELKPLNATVVKTSIDADRPAALHLAKKWGFTEEARYWESRLSIEHFDLSPYAELEPKLMSEGIELIPLSELIPLEPNYKRILFDLDWECTLDEPMPDTPTKPEYEPWIKYHFGNPSFNPESYLIAVHKGDWVGMNELSVPKTQADGVLYNGFTALKKKARGKGIATALKAKNIAWAKQNGFKQIRTWNNSLNRPMLNINEKMGFKKEPAEIAMAKELGKKNLEEAT